jgi:hypothetical protein
MRGILIVLLSFVFFSLPREARADDPVARAELLSRLATTSARFEEMLKKASFTVSGRMEKVSSDGVGSDPKESTFRLTPDGERKKVEVIKYVEDGEDKTAEARQKAADRAKQPKKAKKGDELHLPFLQSEQSKYDFRVGEADVRDPARVRIYFNAKSPAENLLNGSAWVDTRSGDLLSMGVAPSKPPGFVDYLRVQIEFAATTPMGPAVSKLSFEAGGSFLFIKKRYRGSATVADYQLPN